MRKIISTLLCTLLTFVFTTVYGADTFLVGFENGETGYQINSEWYSGYEWEIVDNTETSGINNSDKCFMATITDANPDRWGLWVVVKLDEPILITSENRYFKVMAKRTPNNVNMALCVQGDNPWGANTYFGLTKPAKAGTWGDIVFDLFNDDPGITCENKEVQEFMICFGTWDGTEPGVCMLDNIALSDNSKPRGANEIQAGLLLNFDNEAKTATNFSGFEVQSSEASSEIVDNPEKTEVNPSEKCLVYNKPANTTWWHALQCTVNGIITVEYPNTYLHIMMYIPDATPTTIMAKSASGKEVSEKVYPMDGEGWYDYVLDVSELDYIREINFRFNHESDEDWQNPAGVYYIDDFDLNNQYEARTTITPDNGSNISTSAIDNIEVFVNGNTVSIHSSGLEAISVYSVNGQLIQQYNAAASSLFFQLTNGMYILKAEGKDGKVVTKKIVIR